MNLKSIWVNCYRRVYGNNDYHMGSYFDAVFTKAEKIIKDNGYDPEEYVEAQITWGRNHMTKAQPSLMTGPRAVERFEKWPSKAERLNNLKVRFKSQFDGFNAMANTCGFHAAASFDVSGYDPFFLFMMFKRASVRPADDLTLSAWNQMNSDPLISLAFPKACKEVQSCRAKL